MAELLLFHHAHGLTPGCLAFADEVRAAGHTVHTPDLYEGNIFPDLADGVGYAQIAGFETIIERGVSAAKALPSNIVYAGFSIGVLSAQTLAQTKPGAKGALLFYACVTPSAVGGEWPQGVPVQIHGMDADPFFVDEGDIDAARELVSTVDVAELFLYPGNKHLFADSSLADYDESAARLLMQRTLSFLDSVG